MRCGNPVRQSPPQRWSWGFSYPEQAAKRGLEGRVLIDVEIGKKDSLVNPAIVASDPTGSLPNLFDEAALKLIGGLRCKPRAPSVLAPETKDKYRISVVFEIAPGGRLLAHPASDKQFLVTGELFSPKSPRGSASRISRPPNDPTQPTGAP